MGNVAFLLRQRLPRKRFMRYTEQLLPALYRTARRLTRNSADAEDLVHDACVKAYQAFDKAELRSEAACRAWMFRIMVNAFRDRYRRQQRSPEVQQLSEKDAIESNGVGAAISPEPDPEVLLVRKDFSAAAQAAMALLSPEVRLVVTLFFAEGLTYKEIAAIAACPIGTVMSRLARGRRQLQQRLREHRSILETSPAAHSLPPSTPGGPGKAR